MRLFHLGIIFLFMWFMVIPHELGHAVAARILGFRVFRVIVGFGRPLFTQRLLGFEWEWRRLPFGGVTLTGSSSSRSYRQRFFLVVLAGPLVNAVLTVLPLWLATLVSTAGRFGHWNTSLLIDLGLANAISLVSTLWPREIATSVGPTATDGLLLFRIPFQPDETVGEAVAGYYGWASQERYRQRHYALAVESCEAGLALYPASALLRIQLGSCLLAMNEVDKARETYLEALNATNITPEHRFIPLNNIALTDILSGRRDLLEEADRYSAQVYLNIPWVPGVGVTRGMVLVESGRTEEGLSLLRKGMLEESDSERRADIAAYLAIGERRLGHIETAARYLDIAQTLDPKCRLLNRAKTELEPYTVQIQRGGTNLPTR